MKLKTSVFIALFISVILIGSIIIFGVVDRFFIPTFFFFILLVLIISVSIMKENFEKRGDILFAVLAILLIAGFATYFATGVKAYFDNSHKFATQNSDLVTQIDSLKQNNSYSLSYIDYLNEQIKTVQSNSVSLQSQIDSAQQIQSNPPLTAYRENENERGETDDD